MTGAAPTGVRWTDDHCHLGFDAERFSPGPDDDAPVDSVEVVSRLVTDARAQGVERMITVGCDVASSRDAIAAARSHDGVSATVGLHPHEASNGLDGIEALLGEPEVVAVGECGLDYHYEHSPRADQKVAFAAQIQLANKHALPLMVHTREAWSDTFDILATEGVPDRTIIHCFTGGPDEARRCLDLGAMLSFSGIVTFKAATDVQEAAKIAPDDRLLVETDSPYLAPTPNRGKPNRPSWVPLVGARLAELRGVDPAAIAETTWANAERIYGLDVA